MCALGLLPPLLLCHGRAEVPATAGRGLLEMGCACRSFLFFLPNTSLISRWAVPTCRSPEHFVVHGLEWPGSRRPGGGEPSAGEPERGSGRGDCGGREREGMGPLAHPRRHRPGTRRAGVRVGRWQMGRGLRARQPGYLEGRGGGAHGDRRAPFPAPPPGGTRLASQEGCAPRPAAMDCPALLLCVNKSPGRARPRCR